MDITIRTRPAKEVEGYDGREAMAINIDGKEVFRVMDGEPEDSNLCRDFSDCYKLPKILKKVFDAGKAGETFSLKRIKDENL